jgi:ABC-2 type transport system ATP-binding protein
MEDGLKCLKDFKKEACMGKVIELTDVSKTFKETVALQKITVDFEEGKIHGIIGRNGSGKTVMFKIICGFIGADEGSVKVRGKTIGKEVDVPERVGIIIDQSGFLPHYSGMKNLQFLAALNGKIGKEQIREAIRLVGLDPISKKHVGNYSMGMKQRLSIAQAIMEGQDIIILDEPMNGLDNQGVKDMRILFGKLKEEGKTILLASHNKEDIEVLCDYVYEMEAGVLTVVK